MKTLYWAFAVLVAGITFVISPASAQQNVTCTAQLIGGTVNNVYVPPNATCTLTNEHVQGTVTVAAGASLSTEGASVAESVSATGAALIFLDASSIDHNVNANGTANVEIFGTSIDGNLVVSGAGFISVNGDSIGGNVNDAFNNTGAGNTNLIFNNIIGGNLVCAGNTPPPTNNGSPNTVSGREVGQCAGL